MARFLFDYIVNFKLSTVPNQTSSFPVVTASTIVICSRFPVEGFIHATLCMNMWLVYVFECR